jgi:hypothetical protein
MTARTILFMPPEAPRKRITRSRGRYTAMVPAMKNPMMSHGAITANTFQNAVQNSKMVFKGHLVSNEEGSSAGRMCLSSDGSSAEREL